jgi:hypothetical protein
MANGQIIGKPFGLAAGTLAPGNPDRNLKSNQHARHLKVSPTCACPATLLSCFR